jgi:hypothetical protein
VPNIIKALRALLLKGQPEDRRHKLYNAGCILSFLKALDQLHLFPLQVVALHNDLFLIEGAIKKQEEDG